MPRYSLFLKFWGPPKGGGGGVLTPKTPPWIRPGIVMHYLLIRGRVMVLGVKTTPLPPLGVHKQHEDPEKATYVGTKMRNALVHHTIMYLEKKRLV